MLEIIQSLRKPGEEQCGRAVISGTLSEIQDGRVKWQEELESVLAKEGNDAYPGVTDISKGRFFRLDLTSIEEQFLFDRRPAVGSSLVIIYRIEMMTP